MKKAINNIRNGALVAFILMLSNAALWGQVSDSKKVTKTFNIDKSSIIDIGNKYGDISVETWDKDSVWVEISYKVTEKNYEKLDKKMEEINFELTQSGHYVVVNTIIGDSKNMFMSELVKFKETIGVGESTVEININVKLPDNLDLRLKNKFGNI